MNKPRESGNAVAIVRNATQPADSVGWISDSASTITAAIGGCAIAYPPYGVSATRFMLSAEALIRVGEVETGPGAGWKPALQLP